MAKQYVAPNNNYRHLNLFLFVLTFLIFSTFFVFPATSVQSSTLSITSPQNIIYSSKTVDLEWSSGQPLGWCAYSLNSGANSTSICKTENSFNDTTTSKDLELRSAVASYAYIRLPKSANIAYTRDKMIVEKNGKKIRLAVPTKDGNTIDVNVLESQFSGGFKPLVDGKKLFVTDTQKDVRITDYSFVSDGRYSSAIQFTSIYPEENILEFRDIGSGSYLRLPYSDCNRSIQKEKCIEKTLVVGDDEFLFNFNDKMHAIKMISWTGTGSTLKGVFELDGVFYTKAANSAITVDPNSDFLIFFKNITEYSISDGYYPERAEATIIIGPKSCTPISTIESGCSGTLNIGSVSYSISDINETAQSLAIDAYSGADYQGNIPLISRNGANVTLITGEAGITYSEGQIRISEIDTTETEPEGTGKIIVINTTTKTASDEIDKIIIRENGPSEMTIIDPLMNIYAGHTSYGTYIEDNRVNDILTFRYPDRHLLDGTFVDPKLNVSGYILGSSYPRNLAIDIGDDSQTDYNLAGELNSSSSKTVKLSTGAIERFLEGCSPDVERYCNLPLKFTSDTDGIIRIDSIDIRYILDTKITGKEGVLNDITIWARDTFGNTDSTTQYFTIESKPPIITINSPEDNTLIIGNTTHFNLTTDENATCTYSNFTGGSISYPTYTSYYSAKVCDPLCAYPSPPPASRAISGGGSPYKIMAATGTTQHYQGIEFFPPFGNDYYFLIANCTDNIGNSKNALASVMLREKPLTIDLLTPDGNTFYYGQGIKIYLYLTTNYSVDKIMLNITRPDNTTETFTENDFSRHVGAKAFLELTEMDYNRLTQTGTYTMRLYVNDTQGNSDTATRTFSVYNMKTHLINISGDRQSYIYYTDHDTAELLANLYFSSQGYLKTTLPDASLDLQFYNYIYTFSVVIPDVNLSDETQIETKYINESNLSISTKYIPKEAYAFNILNASRMNKTFKVEFDYIEDHGLTDPTKIVILKAPYNFTTGSIDYSSAIYYRLGDPLYPIYYKEPGTAWIYVNDFSVFALLEDKATSEVCADKIDNDYDGQIDEGCATGSSSSSSGGGSKSAPPIKRECTTNSNCTSTQICSNYKCINITCSTCEYIEDRSCKKYQCCKESECSSGEQCKDHSCIKIVEEKETTIAATGEQILADNAIDSARKAITSATGRKDTKDAEEFLSKAIAARDNNDYANARVLAEKSRLSLESAPLIQGKAIESTAKRPDLLLVALVAILIMLIILVLFPKKKSAGSVRKSQ